MASLHFSQIPIWNLYKCTAPVASLLTDTFTKIKPLRLELHYSLLSLFAPGFFYSHFPACLSFVNPLPSLNLSLLKSFPHLLLLFLHQSQGFPTLQQQQQPRQQLQRFVAPTSGVGVGPSTVLCVLLCLNLPSLLTLGKENILLINMSCWLHMLCSCATSVFYGKHFENKPTHVSRFVQCLVNLLRDISRMQFPESFPQILFNQLYSYPPHAQTLLTLHSLLQPNWHIISQFTSYSVE